MAIKIVKDPENPVEVEALEQAIVDVANGAKALTGSRLGMRAITVLIRDSTGGKLGLGDIRAVLEHARDLETSFLKKLPERAKK